jgi:hypothetical protein
MLLLSLSRPQFPLIRSSYVPIITHQNLCCGAQVKKWAPARTHYRSTSKSAATRRHRSTLTNTPSTAYSSMSFLRFATRTLRPVPVCHFSTGAGGPPKTSSSNLPLYLGGVGITGLGAYLYLGGSAAPFSTTSKPKQKQEKSALDPERFLDLKLKSIEPYNHNTSRFVFELPDGGAALSPITSLVVVRASEGSEGAPVDKKGNPAMRAYTPISSPDQEGELVLLIKKYENGVVSKYVHERLRPNDTLAIKGPIVKFPYKGTWRHSTPQSIRRIQYCMSLVLITFSHARRPSVSFCVWGM